ncbi:hypothetical protein ATCC90586_006949 [Pythium insidiosum]|nr:hypothetical protein ATCC90586_006949 [Pythium insidiosum]
MLSLSAAGVVPSDQPTHGVDTFHVLVSGPAFALCWLLAAALHAVCLLHYAGSSWLYTFFPTTTSSWLLTGYDLALPVAQFKRVSVVFAPTHGVDTFHVLVSGPAFALCWLLAAALHAVCLLHYAGSSWLYTFFPTTTSSWLLTGYDLALPVAQFKRVSVVFAVLSALHAYALLVMAVASIRERRLSFSIGGSTWKLFTRCRLKLAAPQSAGRSMSSTSSAAQLVVGKTGLLGIASPHFDSVLLVREAVQCALQTYQGYLLSQLLPRPHLNRLFVACIVVNCWSAPVVKRLVRRDIPRQRVWCVAFDVALDFVSTIVVPTTIFVTYYEAFDVAKNDFSSDSYFVGSFLIRVVTEFQIFWVQSWLDLVLRVLFALNLINCLDVIKTMIRRRRDRAHAVKAEQPDKQPPPSGQRRVSHFLHAFGRAAFLVGGAAVLAVYLYAVTRREVPQCVLQVHPWLTAKPSCASLELNCPLAGIAGAEADVDRILAALYEPSLVFVYLRHCPALHVPPRIRRLRRLMGLFIHNSTLERWGDEAALSMETHPNMRMFSLVRVRTDSFPSGLLASSFPQKLTDMSLIDVNLTAAQVPADLDTKWSQVLYLYWEQSELLEVPAAITRLPQLVDLSLSGNHISSVPAALLSLPSLWALRINGNPVHALPDPSGLAVSPWLGYLSLESTQFTRLPSWLSLAFWTINGGVLAAANSTLCGALEAAPNATLASELVTDAGQLELLSRVQCEPVGASLFGVDVEFVLSSSALG